MRTEPTHSRTTSQPGLPITDVKVRLVEGGTDALVAWASCVVSGAIKLDNIAIRRGYDGGLFLTYPNKRSGPGERSYPYFNPVSAEAAGAIQNAVLARLAALARAAEAGAAGAE